MKRFDVYVMLPNITNSAIRYAIEGKTVEAHTCEVIGESIVFKDSYGNITHCFPSRLTIVK